jgi:hypothetical protein
MEAAVDEIYITFKLSGWHAERFRRTLSVVNLAPGHPHTESTLARTILEAILEDDAADRNNVAIGPVMQ